MRFSLILGVTLLLTIAASTSIVQARTIRSAHTCGSLGPGINACKCGEIVVKAAKVQKPLVYASPQAINEAAMTREAVGRFSAGTGSNAISSYNPYASGIISTSSSSSSSSSRSSSSSSSSSVGILGKLIGGSYYSFNPISNGASSDSGCGCGQKSEPLEVRDLLFSDTNKQIVPSFEPIGDLCYPSKIEKGKLQVTTKVTPAYPSKITCSPTPEQVCVQVLNGQVDEAGMRKLGLTTAYSGTSAASGGLFDRLNGGNAFGSANSLGKYTVHDAGSSQYGSLGRYDNSGSVVGYGSSGSLGGYSSSGSLGGYGYSGSLGGYGTSSSVGYSSSGSLGGYSSSGNLGGYSSPGNLGGYGTLSSVGYSNSGSLGGYSSAGSSAYGSGYAGYAGVDSLGQLNSKISNYGLYGNKFETLNDVEVNRESAGSYRSDCGDDLELPKDYSYPRLPADPVSLTLAYQNLFPSIIAVKRRSFVPEDKLAFGHRTIPTETASSKKKLDVPEEKLQILDKPVVELKPKPPVPVAVNFYDEQEEVKLAELEAIERERLYQEEVAEQQQQQGNFITYGDLGYAPVNAASTGKWSRPLSVVSDSIDVKDTIDVKDSASGCGPVGPPAPDYVPGSVLVNQEIVKNEDEIEDGIQTDVKKMYLYEDDERSDEDDADDSTSGIFARLKSSAQKYGVPCGAV